MDFKRYFNDRRTIRNYTSQDVPDELIKTIVAEAAHAPNTGNMQTYSVIVTRDRQLKERLAACHFNQPCALQSAALLTFCIDFNRFVRWCGLKNANPGFDNFQSFVGAMIDTSLFAQQFCSAAEMRGLGCCYLGTTTYNAPDIAALLELPELVVPLTTLTLGWPADEGVDAGRLPVEAILHSEKYRSPADQEILAYYEPTEGRPDSAKFISENGKETLAQVFTDVRYPRQSNEHFARIYYDFIVSKGFGMPVKN